MDENEIIEIIRTYEYIPHKVLIALCCNSQSRLDFEKNRKYLERSLKRLTIERYIEYNKKQDAYCVPLFSGKINKERIKALWLLTQFDNIKFHTVSNGFVQVVFTTEDNILYEIVTLSSKTYRIVTASINQNLDLNKRNMPKRIVIVEDYYEANSISDKTLKDINCIALCTVSDEFMIESYDIRGD